MTKYCFNPYSFDTNAKIIDYNGNISDGIIPIMGDNTLLCRYIVYNDSNSVYNDYFYHEPEYGYDNNYDSLESYVNINKNDYRLSEPIDSNASVTHRFIGEEISFSQSRQSATRDYSQRSPSISLTYEYQLDDNYINDKTSISSYEYIKSDRLSIDSFEKINENDYRQSAARDYVKLIDSPRSPTVSQTYDASEGISDILDIPHMSIPPTNYTNNIVEYIKGKKHTKRGNRGKGKKVDYGNLLYKLLKTEIHERNYINNTYDMMFSIHHVINPI